jgi:small subunit ribosomal protein S3
MGQKVNPIGFRLPITRDWTSRWYAPEKEFADFLYADQQIRNWLKTKLKTAAVSRIVIERAWNSVRVTIFTARPGIVIGRKGSEIETMTKKVSDLAGGKQAKIDIIEIKQPEIDAQLVAESVAGQLERRIGFRRAMKKSMQIAMDMGADGIKIRASGRLGGAEIARTEVVRAGTIPLHTLRTTIDYGFAEADTVAGKIGVKCWICKKPEKLAEPRSASSSSVPAPSEVEAVA